MGTLRLSWAAQLLVWLLRDGDGPALLGDLAEEHARYSQAGSTGDAAQLYRYQLYASLAAVLRQRLLESVRAVPWGTTAAAAARWRSSNWDLCGYSRCCGPGSHRHQALRLVMEFPGIVAIAYVATRVHGSAAVVLAGFMLGVAVLMLSLSAEAVSGASAIAFLTVGPIAAVLGWLLHRRWSAVAAAGR
jgi:hypothetical protein